MRRWLRAHIVCPWMHCDYLATEGLLVQFSRSPHVRLQLSFPRLVYSESSV